jgi:hypothetical protein
MFKEYKLYKWLLLLLIAIASTYLLFYLNTFNKDLWFIKPTILIISLMNCIFLFGWLYIILFKLIFNNDDN